MNINMIEFETWMKALRSGEYNRARYALQTRNGMCCLGVACEVLIDEEKKVIGAYGLLKGTLPASQLFAPQWLKDIDTAFYKKLEKELLVIDEGKKASPFLSNLNDYLDLTFDEIADILELVYIHGMLDE